MAAEGSRYELLDELGRGGMGVVHRARDTQLNRLVALKLCTFEDGRGEADARFRREVETCAQLSHPSIVRIFDFGTLDGRLFYTMELLEARDLEHVMRTESPLPPGRLVALLAQAADALAFLHARGIVHRDVKPSNLMVDAAGALKVTDFGLVRVRERTAITEDGETLGTLHYLAPETLAAEYETAPPQDVYALGLVAWELAAGRRPFSGTTVVDLLREIVQLDPPPLAEVQRGTPAWLSELLARCVAKDPAERPTAAEVRDACREPPAQGRGARKAAARGAPGRGAVTRVVATPRPPDPQRMRVAVAVLAVAGALAVGAALAFLTSRPAAAPERSSPSPLVPVSPKPVADPAARPIANVYWLETDRSVLVDFDVAGSAGLSVELASEDGSALLFAVAVPRSATAFHHWIGGLTPSTRYRMRIRDTDRDLVVGRVPVETRGRRHSDDVRAAIGVLEGSADMPEPALEMLWAAPDPTAVKALVRFGSRPTGVGLANRERIAALLGVLREPAAADVLAAFIERGEVDVAITSLRALAACRSPRADAAARKLMAKLDAPVHHDRIFRAIGLRASETAFDVLKLHVDRAELGGGSALGAALARTSPARARELVTRRAKGAPPRVAGVHDLLAAEALGDEEMIRLVAPLLDGPAGAPLRAEAVLSLSAVRHPRADLALNAALDREPLAVDLLIAAGRRRLPGAERAILAGLAPERPPPVRAAALVAAGLLAADPACWRDGAPKSRVFDRVLALASDARSLLHENAMAALARWGVAAGKRAGIKFPHWVDPGGRLFFGRVPAGDVTAWTLASTALSQASNSPAELARRSRLALALAQGKHPRAAEVAQEIATAADRAGDPDRTFPRWAGQELKRLAQAAPGERAIFIDPLEMLHNTGVRVEAGEVVWLRHSGVLGWNDPGAVRPLGHNFRDGTPVSLAPIAIVGNAVLPLHAQWTPYFIERSGELEIWMHGPPHYHTPGTDAALLPSRAQGLVAVWLRR